MCGSRGRESPIRMGADGLDSGSLIISKTLRSCFERVTEAILESRVAVKSLGARRLCTAFWKARLISESISARLGNTLFSSHSIKDSGIDMK